MGKPRRKRRYTAAEKAAALQKFEQATLSNDYLFFRVMQQKAALLPTLQRVLPELGIVKICQVVVQRYLKATWQSKELKLDIFAEDQAGNQFNVEMQVANEHNLIQRSLAYFAGMVNNQLDQGVKYRDLKPIYVIFFTRFDPLGYQHQFERCRIMAGEHQPDRLLNFIYLDVTAPIAQVNPALQHLCEFIETGKVAPNDPFILKLEQMQAKAKMNSEWRDEAMKINLREQDIEYRIEKGIAQGIEQGVMQGTNETTLKMIRAMKDDGLAKAQIVRLVAQSRQISEAEAQRYYQMAIAG